MNYISDSDSENTLTPLTLENVDVNLLRDFYTLASRGTRRELRHDFADTPIRDVFGASQLSQQSIFAFPNYESEQFGTSGLSANSKISSLRPAMSVNVGNGTAEEIRNKRRDSMNIEEKAVLERRNVETAHLNNFPRTNHVFLEDPSPYKKVSTAAADAVLTEDVHAFARPLRSLRRRTFASVHPYIADQADYLEICSIRNINEWFTADSDLTTVVKTLNSLYLRKRKRYPDEYRYSSPNFYVHLGKSRVAALLHDVDSQTQNLVNSSQLSDDKWAPELPHSEVPLFEGGSTTEPINFLIPSSPDILNQLDPDSASDDGVLNLEKESQRSRYSSPEPGSESELPQSESEPEQKQLNKIGGRYKRLSNILKGILPESAKRLSLFQQEGKVRQRKKKIKEIMPRRGLAQRKYGTASAQSAELDRELRSFEPEENDDEPNNRTYKAQAHLTREPPLIIEPHRVHRPSCRPRSRGECSNASSSDESSDSMMGWSFNEQIGARVIEVFDEPEIAIDRVSSGYRTTGEIASSLNKKNSHKSNTKNPKSTRRMTPLPKKPFHQTTLPIAERKRRHHRNSEAQKRRRGLPRTKIAKVRTKPSPKPHKALDHCAALEYRRNPNFSTFVYEIESSNKFVRPKSAPSHNQQHFLATKQSLLNDYNLKTSNSLIPEDAFTDSRFLEPEILRRAMDTVHLNLGEKKYTLDPYLRYEAQLETTKFFSYLLQILSHTDTLLNKKVRNNISISLVQFMKWQILSRQEATDNQLLLLGQTLDLLSKLHNKTPRRLQSPIHSQVLFVYWIFYRLRTTCSRDIDEPWTQKIENYASDFWVLFLQSFLTTDLCNPAIHDSVLVISTILHKNTDVWWRSITNGVYECENLEHKCDSIDIVYFLASLVESSKYNWTPFIAIFSRIRNDYSAEVWHHFIDVCELVVRRMNWPFEERLLTSFYYIALALRKFTDFYDEGSLYPIITGLVRSESDLPDQTVFERFLVMLYRFVSNLDSEREVKKLISKILPTSPFSFNRLPRSTSAFVNRVNLLLLLNQLSNVDLDTHFNSLIHLVLECDDPKIHLKCVEALGTYCEVAQIRRRPIPKDALTTCLKMCGDTSKKAHSSIRSLIKLIGSIVQTTELPSLKVLFLFDIFNVSVLDLVSAVDKTEIIGLLLRSTINIDCSLPPAAVKHITDFQDGFIYFLSAQMSCFTEKSLSSSRELIEMGILLWNVTTHILGNRHWNIMMFQKYSFMGSNFAREYFLCYFCLEYLNDNKTMSRQDDVSTIDKILQRALCASEFTKYVLDLFKMLSRDTRSLFFGKPRPILTVFDLQANKFQILSDHVKNICVNTRMLQTEKNALIEYFLETLQSEYVKNFHLPGYQEMSKQLVEVVRTRAQIENMTPFWVLAANLGFSSRNMEETWRNLPDGAKLRTFNRELAYSIHLEKKPLERMQPWLFVTETAILLKLVGSYTAQLRRELSYWCQLSYVLTVLLTRLEHFEFSLQDGRFFKLTEMLKHVVFSSRNLTLLEVKCVYLCASILEYGILVYEGYREQKDLRDKVELIFKSANLGGSMSMLHENSSSGGDSDLLDLGDPQRNDVPSPQQVYEAGKKLENGNIEDYLDRVARIRGRLFSIPLQLDFEFAF